MATRRRVRLAAAVGLIALGVPGLASAQARDFYEDSIPATYPRPQSAWKATEKAFYDGLLSKGQFDVLIVPFQSHLHGFDRATRSLMTAQLALAIGSAEKVRIPDPYLVARALGDGERRVRNDDVYALANKLGVHRIIWGYVGHGSENLALMIKRQDRPDKGEFTPRVRPTDRFFPDMPFSNQNPPIEVFRKVLPEMVEAAGFAPPTLALAASGGKKIELPASVLAMTKEQADAIRDAYYLQLLASLTPPSAARTAERFAERSFLVLRGVSPKSPDFRYLEARAFMHLGLREAAIRALGTPASREERHLRAVLDGNLTEVNRLTPQIEPGIKALLAHLDANAIGVKYGAIDGAQSRAAAEAMRLPSQAWRLFVTQAMTEWNTWSQVDNLALKQLLDQELPVPGFGLDEIARGAATLGDFAKVERAVALSLLDHTRKLIETEQGQCCAPLLLRPTLLDYLDLVESIGTNNLMRRVRFLNTIQGSADSALHFVNSIEGAYKDHPRLALMRAEIEAALARRVEGAASEGYRRSAYLGALNAMFWEQGQTLTSAEAFTLLGQLGRPYFGNLDNFYAQDYPYRPYYSPWAEGGLIPVVLHHAQAALANSCYELAPLRLMRAWLSQDMFAELLKSIEGRFAGSPEVAVMRAETSAAKGDIKTAAAHYRESIAAQPAYWDSYLGLGTLLFEEGEIAEAAKVFMSYAGFKDGSTEHTVSLSNHAYDAGSLLFWNGNFIEAEPLYNIAANLQNGSEASLASALRLNLIKGDYAAAGAGSIQRAQRYNSAPAYRDYLGILHAMGHSKEAWEGFFVLVRQLDRPQIWETALVGHRREALIEKQIADWSAQPRLRDAGPIFPYAAIHLLRSGVTDRLPSADFAPMIAAADRPVWQLPEVRSFVVRPRLDGREEIVLGPNAPDETGTLPIGQFASAKRVRVKSDLVSFAEAYRAIRLGQFAVASSILEDAGKLYDFRNRHVGYLLPYFAFAAAKNGNIEGVERALERFSLKQQRFDYFLAKASIAGLAGKTEEALRFLKLALHRRPFTEQRPLYTEYQYAELCEWLFEATRNDRYRALAVDWARKNQVAQPWFAWPYAIEAKLSTNRAERRRAIAMTHYLDKDSDRLKAIPSPEIDNALKEFKGRNPFLDTNTAARRPI